METSSYENWKSDLYSTYSVSGDRGRKCHYTGKCYPKLAPKLSFWQIWHDNIGKIPEEENNRFYVQEYWNQVLSKLNPEEVYRELEYSTLLCYEENTEFCHRHIIAAWFEILLGVSVPEAKIEDSNMEIIERPAYIKEYLEDTMRQSKNMRGFHSLRALYLFEKGEYIEKLADELEKETGKCYDFYRESACFYRCDADEEEYRYNKEHQLLRKK